MVTASQLVVYVTLHIKYLDNLWLSFAVIMTSREQCLST